MSRRQSILWSSLAAVLALAFAACGGDDGGSNATTATASPGTSGTANPSTTGTASASGTATGSATSSATATPAVLPAVTPRADGAPQVRWMLAEGAGAGAVTVRLQTDVPTTVILSVFRAPGESGGADASTPVEEKTAGTTHALSVGTGGVVSGYQVIVTAANGKRAIATLESGTVVGTQYFGKGANAPTVALTAGRKASVTWSNLKPDPGAADGAGQVLVFKKAAGCPTAEACPLSFLTLATNDTVTSDANGENHRVDLAIPDGEDLDYRVLIAGKPFTPSAGTPVSWFFQLNVLGSDVK